MKQILIVEDDKLLNKMLTFNLVSDGYNITSVQNAAAAAALEARAYDLALLDINLPDGNGCDLCKLIKPAQPDTMVIFLTANDQESDQMKGYELGAVDYITKPFSIGALQRKIQAMFRMLENHYPPKDIYDDGRLVLNFSGQTASLNGRPLSVSSFISLFGIINLINATLSNQMSRKREISVLSTVVYGAPTAFQFPLLYMSLYLLLLLALEVLLSVWIICKQEKQSLIEQLRAAE